MCLAWATLLSPFRERRGEQTQKLWAEKGEVSGDLDLLRKE